MRLRSRLQRGIVLFIAEKLFVVLAGDGAALPIWMTWMRAAIAGKDNEHFLGDDKNNPTLRAFAEPPAKSVHPPAATAPLAKPARANAPAKPPTRPASPARQSSQPPGPNLW